MIMKKRHNNKGFTMAELLIVVAIIIILAGVAFIAVVNHQRSMTRLEYDTIAKEIFIAAQNHLTMAESQGYLKPNTSGDPTQVSLGKLSEYGTDKADKVYYVTYIPGGGTSADDKDMLEMMLPFGSIDETIRNNGSYIIRYQPSTATVFDVFFSYPDKKTSMLTIKGAVIADENSESSEKYDSLMANCRGDDATTKYSREHFNGGVVGWFGDTAAEALPKGARLENPVIKVYNGDRLYVTVTNPNTSSLVLLITGKSSGAQRTIYQKDDPIQNRYVNGEYILDDITTDKMHFCELKGQKKDQNDAVINFIPGENIIIEAVAYDNTKLTNIAYSGKVETNSLFYQLDDLESNDNKLETASIKSIRHLENLDPLVSNLGSNPSPGNEFEAFTISSAKQIDHLNWNSFKTNIGSDPVKVIYSNSMTGGVTYSPVNTTKDDCYYPISPDYALTYDGQNHEIEGIQVDYDGDAGLFGTVASGTVSEIENLKLIDFSITGTTSAGALAGSLTGTAVNNVVAIEKVSVGGTTSTSKTITASGSAGGLIGDMSAGTVSCSAASLVVGGDSTAYAGGLLGRTTGDTAIDGCYSGGHTTNGAYDRSKYNVTASTSGGVAGGLIGDSGGADISCSYSTCSVKGSSNGEDSNAGGFVGIGGGKINNCYCTGLVYPDKMKIEDAEVAYKNAFYGITSPGEGSGVNYIYEIINEVKIMEDGTVKELKYKEDHSNAVAPFDADETSFNSFITLGSNDRLWTKDKPAIPYDGTLVTYYHNKYFLPTVAQLGAMATVKNELGSYEQINIPENFFVNTHYGDWPAPETFVINK